MKKLIVSTLVFSLSVLAHPAIAEEIIRVERTNFNSLRNDWIQMEMELSYRGEAPDNARSRDFIENVGVKVYLAYKPTPGSGKGPAPEFDFYISEVEIAALERGLRNNVYFYLPGPIAKRDRLRPDPEFFYIELSVNGEMQKPQRNAMSTNIPNIEILNSFTNRANSELGANEHLLMPIYLVTGADIGRVERLPVFLRRDAQ